MAEGVEFAPAYEYAPGMAVPRPVVWGANDPRIPKPAPDPIVAADGSVLVSTSGAPINATENQVTEDDVPKVKASIYSAKGDLFVFAVEDLDGDPVESIKATCDVIDSKIRPLIEACGIKVVDRTSGDLKDALATSKTPVRMPRKVVAS